MMKLPDFCYVGTNSWKLKFDGKYLGRHGEK